MVACYSVLLCLRRPVDLSRNRRVGVDNRRDCVFYFNYFFVVVVVVDKSWFCLLATTTLSLSLFLSHTVVMRVGAAS